AVEQARHVLAQQMKSVLAAAPIGIAITRDRRFVYTGGEFGALLGWPGGALVGQAVGSVFASAADHEALSRSAHAAFDAGRPYLGELRFKRCDGSEFWGGLQGRPVDPSDARAGTIWLLDDVTERRETRE